MHYKKPAGPGLSNMDKHKTKTTSLFKQTYVKDHAVQRWLPALILSSMRSVRNYNNGNEWIVSHQLFHKTGA